MIGHETPEFHCRVIAPEHVLVAKFSDETEQAVFAFLLRAITHV
jgi:hypothetical protein